MDPPCSCGSWPADETAPEGMSLGGLFVVEAWMFAPRTRPGGAFPPALGAEEWAALFGPAVWRSPAHLCRLLAEQQGPAATLRAFHAHWRQWDPVAVLGAAKERGITRLRIPVGWPMFAPPEEMGFARLNGFVADPFSRERAAHPLCPPDDFLFPWLEQASALGMTVLLDLHTLPGETGAGYAFVSWAVAVAAMVPAERDRWLRAYRSVLHGFIGYVGALPAGVRAAVGGLQPSNLGLTMDAESYARPRFAGELETVLVAKKMADFALQGLHAAMGKSMPAIYLNLDNALTPREVSEYMESAAEWLEGMGLDPSEKLVQASHFFALDWPFVFKLPTEETVYRWVLARFPARAAQRWRTCCIEWSAAPPRSRVFLSAAQEPTDPLPAKWKENVFRAFVRAFRDAGTENYFWTWDVPQSCAVPARPNQERTFWSLSCALSLHGQ